MQWSKRRHNRRHHHPPLQRRGGGGGEPYRSTVKPNPMVLVSRYGKRHRKKRNKSHKRNTEPSAWWRELKSDVETLVYYLSVSVFIGVCFCPSLLICVSLCVIIPKLKRATHTASMSRSRTSKNAVNARTDTEPKATKKRKKKTSSIPSYTT